MAIVRGRAYSRREHEKVSWEDKEAVRHQKPDLLVVLTALLGLAILLTTFGGRLLNELDVEAQPYLEHYDAKVQ